MWWILAILAGCVDKAEEGIDGDADADTDSDADADADMDSDADADADADADTDADADSDADSDADADADTDADVEGDLDGDGWAPPQDCDDGDPAVYPGRYEICSDGTDNDCDGLLDCEDGGCAEEDCAERDCEDGADDEGDGLIDCADDECWLTASCGATAQVLGGWMTIRDGSSGSARADRRLDTSIGGAPTWESERSSRRAWFDELEAYSVSGALRVDAAGISCLWYVDRAWNRFFFATTLTWPGTTMGYDDGSSSGRSGFRLSGACPLDAADVDLPNLYGGGVASFGDYGIRVGSSWAGFPVAWWYHGTQAATAQTWRFDQTYSSTASWWSGESSWYDATTWSVEAMLPGEEIPLP